MAKKKSYQQPKNFTLFFVLEINRSNKKGEKKMSDPNSERTYIMIKPDGVQRNLVGEIIKRFEQRGYHLAALKMLQVIFFNFFALISLLIFFFFL